MLGNLYSPSWHVGKLAAPFILSELAAANFPGGWGRHDRIIAGMGCQGTVPGDMRAWVTAPRQPPPLPPVPKGAAQGRQGRGVAEDPPPPRAGVVGRGPPAKPRKGEVAGVELGREVISPPPWPLVKLTIGHICPVFYSWFVFVLQGQSLQN